MKNIPVLTVQKKTLAEAFEAALTSLYENGIEFETQYDKPEDPKSLDCTMNITIDEPLCDPMIHKAFPGGIDDLKEYVMEVKGAKDHWCKNMNDTRDKRWEYTYHGRLEKYGVWRELVNGVSAEVGEFRINQIGNVIDKLVEQPFTRQAQMITWMPNLDLTVFDPPCLQSLWYRIVEEDGIGYLNCNVRFRSNDAWGANFMNMFGFTMFNKEVIAAEISKRTNQKIKLGRMNWHADSYHIYGKDIQQAQERLFNRIKSTDFEDRIYNLGDESIKEIYNEAESIIIEKIKKHDKEH